MSSPEGCHIGNLSKPWTIGRLIGRGACGSVHELHAPPNSKPPSSTLAVKLASLPKSTVSSNGKKRKKTAQEMNADLILQEYQTLQNLGADMRGKYVPDIPYMGSPPAFGEIAGYRFLVMERMASPLKDAVPILIESHTKRIGVVSKIPIGDVAAAMLDCIQGMHKKGLIFVDVKPENFMLAYPSLQGRSSGKTSSLHERIRLIDFGLVESVNDLSISKHRADMHPAAPLVGTPAYASLNVMSGHTASRRDDLEALGYVIAELLLTLAQATSNLNEASKSESKRDYNVEAILPWSAAKSDCELLKIKKLEMDVNNRSNSCFFSRLKTIGVDVVMNNYFLSVQNLKYAETPKYDDLRCYLKKLIVTVGTNGPAVSRTDSTVKAKLSCTHKSTTQGTLKNKISPSDQTDSYKIKLRKPASKRTAAVLQNNVPTRSTRRNNHNPPLMNPLEVISVDSTDINPDIEDMEWEKLSSDENEPPPTACPPMGKAFLNLEAVEGPHLNLAVTLGGSYPDTILIGRNPKSKLPNDGVTKVSLSDDDAASSLHTKLVLTKSKHLYSVKVTDMSSTNGTFINGKVLSKGKSMQAFHGDKIKIGMSTFEIKRN